MAKKKNWLKQAIKRPGALTEKAADANMATMTFAKQAVKPDSKATPQTKKQAQLALTMARFKKKKKAQP